MRNRTGGILLAAIMFSGVAALGAQNASATGPERSINDSPSVLEQSVARPSAQGARLAAVPAQVPDVTEPATGTPDALPTRGQPVQVGAPLGPNLDEIIPLNSGEGRRAIYSISLQRVWVVDENGVLIKTHRVSGKTGEPDPGNYTVWSRSISTFAAHNPSIRWGYMVRFAFGDRGGNIGFHEIPNRCGQFGCYPVQSEDELGTPLSGGCVRQATVDAQWMWDWAQIGTKVVVLA